MYVVSNMLAKAWIHACGLRTAATTMCCGTNWFTIGDARPPQFRRFCCYKQLTQETFPLVDQEEEGAEGAEGQGGRGMGLAGGSGGWLVAGRQGPGAGWWVWRHGGMVAWVHGRE